MKMAVHQAYSDKIVTSSAREIVPVVTVIGFLDFVNAFRVSLVQHVICRVQISPLVLTVINSVIVMWRILRNVIQRQGNAYVGQDFWAPDV